MTRTPYITAHVVRTHRRRSAFRLRPLAAVLALSQFAYPAAAAIAGVTHLVNTCDDPYVLPVCNGDDGTLRQALWCAGDGDTIDMTQLQCSTVTLSSPLVVGPIGVIINGPGRDRLTIDAGDAFRALVHNGKPEDTLVVSEVSIKNGQYENPYTYGGGGGCIFSSGNVYLFGTDVSNCYSSAASTIATGGAIYAKGTATLTFSSVSGGIAQGKMEKKYSVARGGGIFADTVNLYASTVSGNIAASTGSPTEGGGVYARHFVGKYSIVDTNLATKGTGGGVKAVSSLLLANSTISHNIADTIGGAATATADPVNVYNSTIAFNSATMPDSLGGIGATTIRLESTIVANNLAAGAASDFGASGAVSGANNLILAYKTPVPADTLIVDPMLGPLQDNGGFTRTHALGRGSPAIDHGNNAFGSEVDQNLFLRISGSAADIGATEFDGIFGDAFEPSLPPGGST